ncbi:MAG: outer membrane lipoprotein-sorting protein [Deltaproteobacteria bacterium]|nr:outer membrane lipoprotein-sorting protein [Deltaproteobacteria bacterium]
MLWLLVCTSLALPTLGQEPPSRELAEKIIDDMEARMRGKASVGEMEMHIQRWDRTMRMKFWELYPDRSLAIIVSPAEDAGKGSLKIGRDLWSYDPNIDQVQKIPPSLMLDSWMGSDFSNDDVSRSSSVKLDYDVSAPEEGRQGEVATWRITLTPKPESPVVWEKEVVEVAREDFRPLRQEFYDEKGRLARVLVFEDFRPLRIDGETRLYPFVWRMENLQEKGRTTTMRVLSMEFRDSLPESRFSIRALKKAR